MAESARRLAASSAVVASTFGADFTASDAVAFNPFVASTIRNLCAVSPLLPLALCRAAREVRACHACACTYKLLGGTYTSSDYVYIIDYVCMCVTQFQGPNYSSLGHSRDAGMTRCDAVFDNLSIPDI